MKKKSETRIDSACIRQPKIVSLDKFHPRNRYLKLNSHYYRSTTRLVSQEIPYFGLRNSLASLLALETNMLYITGSVGFVLH